MPFISKNNRLLVTIDVEAQPPRAEQDPLERLIWGRFPGCAEAGIDTMMDIADRHGVKLVLFLDYCERDLYGEGLLDVARHVHARGHNLQLHAHPDFFNGTFWERHGIRPIHNLNDTTHEQASALFDFLVEQHEACTGERPLAYRGGGYRFNEHTLQAMHERGIRLHSSYNPPRKTQPLDSFRLRKQFFWSNGVLEVPISCLPTFLNLKRPIEFNFNTGALSTIDKMRQYLKRFYKRFGNDALAVMVMHSWSLLEFDNERGIFTGPSEGNVERFDAFLAAVKNDLDVITSRQVLDLVDAGRLAVDGGMDLMVFRQRSDEDGERKMTDLSEILARAEELWNDSEADPDNTRSVALFRKAWEMGDRATSGYRLGVAHYEGTGAEQDLEKAYEYFSIPELDEVRYALLYRGRILKSSAFPRQDFIKAREYLEKALEMGVELAAEDLQSLPRVQAVKGGDACPICNTPKEQVTDMNGRQCPGCKSLERQRIFALACRQMAEELNLAGGKGLVISPAVAEVRFLREMGVASLTSVDVRPEARPDIVADICNMPEVEDDAYDFVVANYVFPCVHDLDAALKEIRRVLKPGGKLLSVDHVQAGEETREFADEERITSWYGKENYEKYKVGSFRQLGEKDWFERLAGFFNVQRLNARDPVTGLELPLMISSKAVCSCCGAVLAGLSDQHEYCPSCGAAARTRSLPEITEKHVVPRLSHDLRQRKPLLGLSMHDQEFHVLEKHFPRIRSASLFGDYGFGEYADQHETGVDVRDLSRYADESFSAIMGILLFDYFTEHEQALRECFRTLAPGGALFTHIADFRLLDGDEPPREYTMIKPKPGYFDYYPEGEEVLSIKVGREWFINAMRQVGFDAAIVQVKDPATGIISDWFIGFKPENQASTRDLTCSICGAELKGVDADNEGCPECGARARTRTLPHLLEQAILPRLPEDIRRQAPLLGFAMSGAERRAVSSHFPVVKSASLFGDYGSDHETGVDVRDLSRYADESFSAIMGILLFDYFTEHEQALRECARVLKPGGALFTQIAPYRLTDGREPPTVETVIQKKAGYFDYIPDDVDIISIKVGREWFMDAMREVGLEPHHVILADPATGMDIDWFVGFKPAPGAGEQAEEAGQEPAGRRHGRLKGLLGGLFTGGAAGKRAASHGLRAVITELPSLQGEPTSKTYSVPLPGEGQWERLELRLFIPPIPPEIEDCEFAEHVMDANTGEATDTLIVCGRGFVGVSDDLGQSWRRIDIKGAEDIRLWNSFTTAEGNHVIQALGWQGPEDGPPDPERHAALFVFDRNWQLLDKVKTGFAYWHGTASVAQAGNTIMYAEYHNNSAMFTEAYKEDPAAFKDALHPCHVWRSRDGGLSWEVVFSQSPPAIRHFHAITPDPFKRGCWWLSSGDTPEQCRVWRSDDDGDTWHEATDPSPRVELPERSAWRRQSAHRYTDLVVLEDKLFWGCDDPLGDDNFAPDLALAQRGGARLFLADKEKPLVVREAGYIGNPVRKITDVGPAYLLSTEAKEPALGLRPSVWLVMKDTWKTYHVLDVDNFNGRPTGFTYSRGSVRDRKGTFFTYRLMHDALAGSRARLLGWQVSFIPRT